MSGFIYPNELLLQWDLIIVIYPYITGLVAGAFIISALYHVFGLQQFKPIARFSLITALSFLLIAPLPLILHLGKPERALEMFFRPNLISAMSGFGYIWFFYLLLVISEIWLVFRQDIIRYVSNSTGAKKQLYVFLTLGSNDVSEKALAFDHKLSKILSCIGIPAACLLHGYVGFIFGAIKANPWWSTPLMPIIFLLSAIVSGIALVLVLYAITSRIRKTIIDHKLISSLSMWLGGFLTVAAALEGLEVFSMVYESSEAWDALRELITQKIAISYIGIQGIAGALLPLALLAASALMKLPDKVKTGMRIAGASLVLVGVFAMRWNVVIGGQLLSKSLRGFITYQPPLFGEGSITIAAGIMVLPFIILIVLAYIIPPWEEEPVVPVNAGLKYGTSSL